MILREAVLILRQEGESEKFVSRAKAMKKSFEYFLHNITT